MLVLCSTYRESCATSLLSFVIAQLLSLQVLTMLLDDP